MYICFTGKSFRGKYFKYYTIRIIRIGLTVWEFSQETENPSKFSNGVLKRGNFIFALYSRFNYNVSNIIIIKKWTSVTCTHISIHLLFLVSEMIYHILLWIICLFYVWEKYNKFYFFFMYSTRVYILLLLIIIFNTGFTLMTARR